MIMDFELIKNQILSTFKFLQPYIDTNIQFINISVGMLLLIILITLIVLQLIKFFKFKVLKTVQNFAKQKNIKILNLIVEQINKIGNPFFITATLYFVGSIFKELNGVNNSIFYPAFVIVCGFYSIGIIKETLSWFITSTLSNPSNSEEDKKDEAFIQMIQTITGILTYVFVFITVAQILNWNITALVSILGVSSIAIAFAMQNILADVFAAFTIYIDQPFRPGDQVILSEFTGTVKKIGLKSTRISLLDGDELIVSNRDLTTARVRNLRKIRARRVLVHINLDFDTPLEKIKKAKEIITSVINTQEDVILKRINFIKFNHSGKEIEYVYLIEDEQYDAFCLAQETINFSILQGFEENGIKISTINPN
jgi:small-conductance mechanosensitive channel